MRIKGVLIGVFLMLWMPLASAKVYEWKDSQGITHFSDQPHVGAKELNVPEPQRFTALPTIEEENPSSEALRERPAPEYRPQSLNERDAIRRNEGSGAEAQRNKRSPRQRNERSPTQRPKVVTRYEHVAVNAPQQQATIRNNDGSVNVVLDFTPDFDHKSKIFVFLDGKPYGIAQQFPVFSIKGVDRGTHTLSVQVKSEAGAVLGESSTVTFHMHRWRVSAKKAK